MIKLNLIYNNDNLNILKQIGPNIIDLIYIDPPFYTGNDFGEFNDKWESIDHYLSFMEVRIKEMHRILKDTGSFYCHCDTNAVFELKPLIDRIFGKNNFRREIIWNVGSVSGFKSKTKNWVRQHDNILFYTKTNKYKFNRMYLPYSEEYIKNKFVFVDENGERYRKRRNGRQYLKDSPGIPIGDVWNDIISFQTRTRSSEYTGYPTQKPEKLLERIILSSTDLGDIVADFFCGSGTTLVVAKRLGRKFIGVDINKKAVEISRKRIYKNISLLNWVMKD